MKRKLLEHFEGVVEFGEIKEDSFMATLYDVLEIKKQRKKNPDYVIGPEAVAEFKKTSIPESEREFIQEGFVFDWKIYETEEEKGESTIKFHRPKVVTQEDLDRYQKEAKKLMDELGWEDLKPQNP